MRELLYRYKVNRTL